MGEKAIWGAAVPEEVARELRLCLGCREAEVLTWAAWRRKEELKVAGPRRQVVLLREIEKVMRRRRLVLEAWEARGKGTEGTEGTEGMQGGAE